MAFSSDSRSNSPRFSALLELQGTGRDAGRGGRKLTYVCLKFQMEQVVVFPPPLLLPSSSKQAINMEILKARENSECSPSC